MPEDASVTTERWEELDALLDEGAPEALEAFLQLLPPEETAYTIAHLAEDKQTRLLAVLSARRPEFAADLMEHFDDAAAADMIEQLDPPAAAAIVDRMDSDEQADVLGELHEDDAEAILGQMDPVEAEDARDRLQYPEDVAGGLMITEYIAYPPDAEVDDVIHDLRQNAQKYGEYEMRYLYLVEPDGRFASLAPLQALVTAPLGRRLWDMRVWEPTTVEVNTPLDEIEHLFDRVDFSALPVVDEQGRMCGVVQRHAVQEAISERSTGEFLKFGGIIGGEELRSMPLRERWPRRLMFLGPNLVLSFISVSIIAVYEPTIQKLTILAAFLPLVANLSGAAGNQAVAVSIRELALGLILPRDLGRVLRKEVLIGLFNGLVIGAMLMGIIWVFQYDSVMLGAVVGAAYALNSVFAVCIGGSLPLLLKAAGVDPAMVSGPILTTLTDMGAFFLTLTFATLMLVAVA